MLLCLVANYLFSARVLSAVSACLNSTLLLLLSSHFNDCLMQQRVHFLQTNTHTHRRTALPAVAGSCGRLHCFVHFPAALPHSDTLNWGHRVLLVPCRSRSAAPLSKTSPVNQAFVYMAKCRTGFNPQQKETMKQSDNKLQGLEE